MDAMKPVTRAKLIHPTNMLLSEFESLPKDVVVREIEQVTRLLLQPARFDDYIPILAYRVAREHLRERIADLALASAA
jgi:hypothetical protein